MNKIDFKIFELPLEEPYGGKYLIGNNIIIVNDINDTDSLIHELTHHLWFNKNKKLLKYLNIYGLNFKTKPYARNRVLMDTYNACEIKKYYPIEDWVEEAVAYFMASMPHDLLWKLGIEQYRDILDDTFIYCNKDGDVISKYDGEVVIKDWVEFKDHVEFFKIIGAIE